MRKIVPAVLLLLIAGCHQHTAENRQDEDRECKGYSDGYTARC